LEGEDGHLTAADRRRSSRLEKKQVHKKKVDTILKKRPEKDSDSE
jgi:hypothetical protein